MRRALMRTLVAVAIAVVGLALADGTLGGLAGAAPYVVPPLLLLLLLRRRRYPGERMLLALAGRRRTRRRAGPTLSLGTGRPLHAALPRGGRLIASSLAVRPPPVRVLAPMS